MFSLGGSMAQTAFCPAPLQHVAPVRVPPRFGVAPPAAHTAAPWSLGGGVASRRWGSLPALRAKADDREEDDDEREAKRLQRILDKRLVFGGEVMKEDGPAFAALAAVQALPLLGGGSAMANFGFFWATAVLSVYLGAKRAAACNKAGEVFQSLNVRNAIAAPIAASFSLFGVYYLLQNFNLDIATIYQLMTTGFGWLCLRDVVASGALALGVAGTTAQFSTSMEEEGEGPLPGLGGAKGAGAVVGAAICGAYLWASHASPGLDPTLVRGALLLAANFITAGIALQAQTTISLKALRPALLFLIGLFIYDVYFVFLSPGSVMETVATSVEGPVKFLSPRAASTAGQYPFSILGLGDVVIPGSFVGLLKKLDDSLEDEGEGDKAVFFKTGIAAYGIGLLITFAANLLSARGQPALLYINPSLIVGALAAAGLTGQWAKLWGFGEEKDE